MFRKLMKSRKLRTRTSWIVALVLIPPFIFAFHLFFDPTPDTALGAAAGTIFGKPIPWDEYQQHYTQTRRRLESRLAGPDGVPVQLPDAFESLIVDRVWNRLILIEEAKNAKLRISDEELARAIRSDPVFQFQGRFAPDRYRQVVRAIGFTPRTYEAFLRDQLLAQRLVDDVWSAVSVTDADVREAFVEANERLKVALIVIDPTTLHGEIGRAITEEELRTDYEARPDLVKTPAQITFEYVGLTRDELTDSLTLPEEEILDYYEANYGAEAEAFDIPTQADLAREEEITPEEPLAEEDTTPALDDVREEIREALLPRHTNRRLNALAVDLEDALDANQSFAEIATALELSTQTVGPIAVGNLFAEGTPEPSLLQAAFDLEEGAMSELIETDNGVYVLRVSQRIPVQIPPFETVRPAIKERLVQERAQQAARSSADELHTQLTEQLAVGATITEAADQLGIALTQPAPFTRTEAIESIGAVSAVNRAAFNTPLGELTEVITTTQGFVLLVPAERIPPDDADLAGQRARLRARVLQEKQDAYFAEWMADLRSRANLQSFLELSVPELPDFIEAPVPGPPLPAPTDDPSS